MSVGTDRATVVVTGLGATTPLGGDVRSTWRALLDGRSGVRRLTEDWAAELPVRIAAPVLVEPGTVIDRVQMRRLDRCEQLALVAAREAWADAGTPQADPDRIGVAVSSGIGGVGSTLSAYDTLNAKGWQRLSPYTVPMLMPNGSAGWISLEINARAGVHTTVSACASGAESVGYAIEMIRSGRADVVLAGGTEAAIIPLNLAAFAAMRALSLRNDEPERASRPFDKSRNGFVLGEGAAMLVLESAEHAARRGANVLAVAAGYGYSADAHHIAQPSPDGRGAALAMTRALADAGLQAAQVVHVNAHATSTEAGDLAEARAIATALGDAADGAVVSATKSMTGHLLGGAGALESVATILALGEGVAPPTINLDDPDYDVAIDIATEPRPLRPRRGGAPMVAVNNSFGFGGHNVALAFTVFSGPERQTPRQLSGPERHPTAAERGTV
jgi:3-oxoacyl-[acyl-carrier-protein] synthase II